MSKLEVALVLVAPNLKVRGEYRCLLVEKEGKLSLPSSAARDGNTTPYIASVLLKNHTGLQARVNGSGWVELEQHTLHETQKDGGLFVVVPYGAIIPEEVSDLQHPGAKWVSVVEAFSADFVPRHKEILQGVIARMQ